MATYIDTTYIEAFISADVLESLYTDAGVYESTNVDQHILTASNEMMVIGTAAGYSMSTTTTTDETVKQATFGIFLEHAYGRKGIPVPPNFNRTMALVEQIRKGEVILVGTPAADMSVGGAEFTPSDPTDTDGIATGDTRPAQFKTLMTEW
jgi:hypothetical protein